MIHKILEFFIKYWNNSQNIGIIHKVLGIIHRILEFFTKYWNSLGMSLKTSKLTVMHLKPFKSRFTHARLASVEDASLAGN